MHCAETLLSSHQDVEICRAECPCLRSRPRCVHGGAPLSRWQQYLHTAVPRPCCRRDSVTPFLRAQPRSITTTVARAPFRCNIRFSAFRSQCANPSACRPATAVRTARANGCTSPADQRPPASSPAPIAASTVLPRRSLSTRHRQVLHPMLLIFCVSIYSVRGKRSGSVTAPCQL